MPHYLHHETARDAVMLIDQTVAALEKQGLQTAGALSPPPWEEEAESSDPT